MAQVLGQELVGEVVEVHLLPRESESWAWGWEQERHLAGAGEEG